MKTVKEVNQKIVDINNSVRKLNFSISDVLIKAGDPEWYTSNIMSVDITNEHGIKVELDPLSIASNTKQIKNVMEQITKIKEYLNEYIELLEKSQVLDIVGGETEVEVKIE